MALSMTNELTELGIVDTHCHMWRLELARQTGLTPELKPLFRTFEPKDLTEASRQVGVRMCVLIEAGTTAEENRTIEQMAASSELIAAIAPYVNLESLKLEDELDYWQQNPKFRGVRARFEGHPDPDILARPSIVEGLCRIAQRGLVFEFLVRSGHLKDILKVYERTPELKGVIEHMAKPDVVEGSDSAEWHQHMKALARNINVTCKLSLSPRVEQIGELLANLGKGWLVESIKPYVQFLLEHYGCDRLMWGSDWPVALLVSDYTGTYRAMREAIGPLAPADELRLFRKTAVQFYGLPTTEKA